jgi:hypothetical protein
MENKPRIRDWQYLGLTLLCAAALSLAGCARTGTVTGKVTYKGKPVPGAMVSFIPDPPDPGKPTVSSQTGDDGSYEIRGVATGPVKVTVDTASSGPRPTPPTGPPPGQRAPGNAGGGKEQGNVVIPEGMDTKHSTLNRTKEKTEWVKVPEKYAGLDTPLKYDVKAGSQEFPINIP